MISSSIIERLKKAKSDKKLILFSGSGLSRNLKRHDGSSYPDWFGLIKEMYEHPLVAKHIDTYKRKKIVTELNNSNVLESLLEISKINIDLSILKSTILKQIFPSVHQNLNNREILEHFHSKLLSICDNKVITTNYDDAFETANIELLSNFHINDGAKNVELPSSGEFLFKLHGDISIPSSCVLFKSDYNSLYVDEGRKLRETVEGAFIPLLKSNFVLFIGYSVTDVEIQRILTYLRSVGTGDLVNRLFFISTEEPLFDDFDLRNNWINVEFEAGDISKAYKDKIAELYDYLNQVEISKERENTNLLIKRANGLNDGTTPITYFIDDLDRFLVDSPKIFNSNSDETKILFNIILDFIIEAKFVRKNEEESIMFLFQKLDQFSFSDEHLILEIVKVIFNGTNSYSSNYEAYLTTIVSLTKIIKDLESIDEKYSSKILESGILQNGLLSRLSFLKQSLSTELNEKQKPIIDFFAEFKKGKASRKFQKIRREELFKKLSKADFRYETLSSNLTVDDYIFVKCNLKNSMNYNPNIRFSILLNDDDLIVGYVDKHLAFISIDENERQKKLINSYIIEKIHNKKDYFNKFNIFSLVDYFAFENMIQYRSSDNGLPVETPCLFAWDKDGNILSYKDVFGFIIDSNCKNDIFFNKSLAEVFNDLPIAKIPLELKEISFQNLQDENMSNYGFLVKSGAKKTGFFYWASYLHWLRYIDTEIDSNTKLHLIIKEINEKAKKLDGDKTTFIIEPSIGNIIESFDGSNTLIDLIKYFARLDTLEVALLEKHENAFNIVSTQDVFKTLNKYFLTL